MKKLWPGMIFGLIGLNFCVVGVTVWAAHANSAAFSVVKDYDRKALDWETTARQLRTNEVLGWSLRIDGVENGVIKVTLNDREGAAIEGAAIALEAFHHAHAREKLNAVMSIAGAGSYACAAKIDTPGLWDFAFTVRFGSETFTSHATRVVAGSEGGTS